jgi:hypothetical protein
MWRVVTGMTNTFAVQARTALSPEWDHGFDEAFTDLISGDPDWVRDEFDALIGANFDEPPEPAAPPAPPAGRPQPPPPSSHNGQNTPTAATHQTTTNPSAVQRPPP